MNAADQRRLTPFLAGACAVAAAIFVTMLCGVGDSVRWGPAGTAQPASAGGNAAHERRSHVPPLHAYAAVWQRPLFNQDRQPAPSSGDAGPRVSLGDLQLTGIIITPGLRMALMHDRKTHHDIRVREGASVPDGSWVLHELQPRRAVFVDGAKHVTLQLKVPEGHDQQQGHAAHGGHASDNSGAASASPQHRRATGRRAPVPALRKRRHQTRPANASRAAEQARQARIEALKARIQQRRRAMHARRPDGDSHGS